MNPSKALALVLVALLLGLLLLLALLGRAPAGPDNDAGRLLLATDAARNSNGRES